MTGDEEATMDITTRDVEWIAQLARLALTETEREAFRHQLSDILTYVEQLKELDTAGVDLTATGASHVNVFREDEPRPSLPLEQVMANAPESADGFFVVPKIIEGKT
jgi:aspartyl-tRNA(Asn)/glutamyl-tRNA(Gln) amidotransferase subunit C